MLKSDNQALHDKALRAMTVWSDASALPDLLELAKKSEDEKERLLALRGYIQVTGTEVNIKKRVKLYQSAVELARRPDEKNRIIGGLRKVHRPEVLEMLEENMSDDEVRRAAERALVDVAWDMRKRWAADVADTSKMLIETSKDKSIVKKAERNYKETKGKKNRNKR